MSFKESGWPQNPLILKALIQLGDVPVAKESARILLAEYPQAGPDLVAGQLLSLCPEGLPEEVIAQEYSARTAEVVSGMRAFLQNVAGPLDEEIKASFLAFNIATLEPMMKSLDPVSLDRELLVRQPSDPEEAATLYTVGDFLRVLYKKYGPVAEDIAKSSHKTSLEQRYERVVGKIKHKLEGKKSQSIWTVGGPLYGKLRVPTGGNLPN
jgi:hypothetical protein